MFFDDSDILSCVSLVNGHLDGNWHILLALEKAKEKLEKLNSLHFCQAEENCLFLFLSFSLLDGDSDLFISEYNRIIHEYRNYYNHVFLMGHEKISHIDICKQQYHLFKFSEESIENMDKEVHVLHGLCSWEIGTEFYPEYRRLHNHDLESIQTK